METGAFMFVAESGILFNLVCNGITAYHMVSIDTQSCAMFIAPIEITVRCLQLKHCSFLISKDLLATSCRSINTNSCFGRYRLVSMANKGISSATCISASVWDTFEAALVSMETRAKLCLQLHHCPHHGVYRCEFSVLFYRSSILGIFLTHLHLIFSPKKLIRISFFLRELDTLSTK